VNVIVIILIAVIVLLSIIGLYFSNWASGAQSINIDNAKNDACRRLSTNCYGEVNRVTLKSFDADKDGVLDLGMNVGECSDPGLDNIPGNADDPKDNLYMLCKCYYNANEDQCRDVCVCKGIAPISEDFPPEGP
jgi:hypothetical protein